MKFLNEIEKILGVSCYSSKQLFIIKLEYEGNYVKDLHVLKEYKFDKNICSMNYNKSLNRVYLGTFDSSIIIIDLKEKNEKTEEFNNIHRLICNHCSEIEEIVVIEGDNSSCWGAAVNNYDRKLFIIDLKNLINYEVSDSLIAVFYFSVKSKIELFVMKERLYMALVSHEAEIVVFYEIVFKEK